MCTRQRVRHIQTVQVFEMAHFPNLKSQQLSIKTSQELRMLSSVSLYWYDPCQKISPNFHRSESDFFVINYQH